MTAGWPVARRYTGRDRVRISLPVGGIGTGTVGFGGRGQFRDWEIENRPAKGLNPALTFLACRVRESGQAPGADPTRTRVLEGDLFDDEAEGALGAPAGVAGLPRFAECEYESCYPFGRVVLADPSFPLRASVEAFNPLVPGDADTSGLPLMSVRVVLTNDGTQALEAGLMFSVENLVGHALRAQGARTRPVVSSHHIAGAEGYLFGDEALDASAEAAGTLAVAVSGAGGWLGPVWDVGKWNQGLLSLWRAFAAGAPLGEDRRTGDGIAVSAAAGAEQSIAAIVGADRTVPAGGSATVDFLLGWCFPNRRNWTWAGPGPAGGSGEEWVGNAYAAGLDDAWDVIARHGPRLGDLRSATEAFTTAFWASDVDTAVKEAALWNLSTLRSNTFFRTADGRPFGWEGCLDEVGSCLGSCTHVWNYDLATPYVFGGLARQMRELEYEHATAADGGMSFRIMLPLDRAQEIGTVAADGQFGCIVKLYREWRLSGDDDFLQRTWPACRRSLEFAWIEGGWDADQDGLAEGAQHNTMDVEYYGPNPVVQTWYLAALQSAAKMAVAMGDAAFGERCTELFTRGVELTETQLYNGEYYRQRVIPPEDLSRIPSRLRHPTMGAMHAGDPEFQIGEGCIIDQLVGDTYARVTGLTGALDPVRSATALDSIHRYNYVPDFGDWANCMRTYAIRGERGHLVESFPGRVPPHPMPYWSEVWAGLEYVYATGLAQHGRSALAIDVVRAARERYAGGRRNPFDEEECGHHYARSMASWGVFLALTGFGYDARSGEIRFAESERTSQWFWSAGDAWGTVRQVLGEAGARTVELEVQHGQIYLDRAVVGETVYEPLQPGSVAAPETRTLTPIMDRSEASDNPMIDARLE